MLKNDPHSTQQIRSIQVSDSIESKYFSDSEAMGFLLQTTMSCLRALSRQVAGAGAVSWLRTWWRQGAGAGRRAPVQ